MLDKRARANAMMEQAGYRALDVAGIEAWLLTALAEFSSHPIEAIIPVAHGAAVAGIAGGVLAFPPLDYEQIIPDEVMAEYRTQRDAFALTGSPALPDGLNLGSQSHWLEALHGDAFRRATLVPWAQYWAWFLSGEARSEVTSLGCHSDLWMPGEAEFSPMAKRRGWAGQFAALAEAGDVVGPLRHDLAARTGLSSEVRIHAGLHDSNAALHAAREFAEISGAEATVLSTGTWFIAMRLGTSSPSLGGEGLLSDLPEARDCLVNVDVFGQPVPSARYMGGREIELLGGRIDQPGIHGLGEALGSALILPSQIPGCGPFPDAASTPPTAPSATAIALYAALMTDTTLDLIGAKNRLLIEGRFAASELFTRALATLRPGTAVYNASSEADASFGALRLIWPDLRPAGALQHVAPLDADLNTYRAKWRSEIQRRGTKQ